MVLVTRALLRAKGFKEPRVVRCHTPGLLDGPPIRGTEIQRTPVGSRDLEMESLDEIVDTRIINAENDVWEVAFALHIVRRLEYTLRLVRSGDSRVEWSLVEGVFRVNTGSWTLEALDDGSRTRAVYEVETQVGMYVPRTLMKTLVSRSLPDMLERFKNRAENC